MTIFYLIWQLYLKQSLKTQSLTLPLKNIIHFLFILIVITSWFIIVENPYDINIIFALIGSWNIAVFIQKKVLGFLNLNENSNQTKI